MPTGRPAKKGETELLKASVSPLLKRGIEHLVEFVSPHHTWNTLAVQWLEERLMIELNVKTALELKAKVEALDETEAAIPFEALKHFNSKAVAAIMAELSDQSEEQNEIGRIPLAIVRRHVEPDTLAEALAKHSASLQTHSTEHTHDSP